MIGFRSFLRSPLSLSLSFFSFCELVPLCNLPTGRRDDLVPVVERRTGAAGTTELEAPDYLKYTCVRMK